MYIPVQREHLIGSNANSESGLNVNTFAVSLDSALTLGRNMQLGGVVFVGPESKGARLLHGVQWKCYYEI